MKENVPPPPHPRRLVMRGGPHDPPPPQGGGPQPRPAERGGGDLHYLADGGLVYSGVHPQLLVLCREMVYGLTRNNISPGGGALRVHGLAPLLVC